MVIILFYLLPFPTLLLVLFILGLLVWLILPFVIILWLIMRLQRKEKGVQGEGRGRERNQLTNK